MSLLAPLFLLGAGFIALPLWLHRLQTQTPEREPFSSAMLLKASEQRIHLQKKLRFLLLLALRILFLALLALAFAKPVIESTNEVLAGDDVTLLLIVMDTSLSMSASGRIGTARDTAAAIIASMQPGQQAQVISADHQTRLVGNLTGNKDALVTAVKSVEARDTRLDFGRMMGDLNGLLNDYNQNVAVHLVSDFQASGMPARFADLIPRAPGNRPVELLLHRVGGVWNGNRSVEYVRQDEKGVIAGIRSYQESAEEVTLELLVNGVRAQTVTASLPANATAQATFAMPALADGDNRLEVRFQASDELPTDDQRYFVLENSPPEPVLLITGDTGSRAVTYLRTALQTGRYTIESASATELDPRILSRFPWIVIDDLGIVTGGLAQALQDYLTAGGSIFAALGEHSQGLDKLPVSGQPLRAPGWLDRSQSRNVARIDTSHPVLFNTPGWRSVNISRNLLVTTDESDKVLITLEGGEPLLLERQTGAGRLLLLTTSLDNTWSDLPIHAVFVSFMGEVSRYLANEDLIDRQQNAGDSILLRQVGSASGQVVDPQGNSVLTLADTRTSQHVILNQTGFYEVYTPGKDILIAVNTDARESDLREINEEMTRRWQDSGRELAVDGDNVIVAVEPVTIELWHFLLLAMLLIVLAETILGNRYLDYRAGQET